VLLCWWTAFKAQRAGAALLPGRGRGVGQVLREAVPAGTKAALHALIPPPTPLAWCRSSSGNSATGPTVSTQAQPPQHLPASPSPRLQLDNPAGVSGGGGGSNNGRGSHSGSIPALLPSPSFTFTPATAPATTTATATAATATSGATPGGRRPARTLQLRDCAACLLCALGGGGLRT
jgi:hypothetical protein